MAIGRQGALHILGADGFIGGHLLRYFQARGDQPVVSGTLANCDLLDPAAIDRHLADLAPEDTIILAAGITRLIQNDYDAMIKNMTMVQNLVRHLARQPVAQLVFLSTIDVYGAAADAGPLREDLPAQPRDYYGLGKLTCENLLHFARPASTALTILRLTGVYGPGGEGQSAIGAMVKSARDHATITVLGPGHDIRDYVLVDDVCDLLRAVIAQRQPGLFNVASGQSYPVAEMARQVATAWSGRVDLVFKQEPAAATARPHQVITSVSRLKTTFPGVTMRDTAQGIPAYVRHLNPGGPVPPQQGRAHEPAACQR